MNPSTYVVVRVNFVGVLKNLHGSEENASRRSS